MPRARRNEWAVLLTLSLGFFMTLLDLTIVNIAIPAMRSGLRASLAEVGWVINAYVIVLAVLMITAGRLGDLRGRKNLFLAGVAVFTLASAASGLSQDATELIAARVVQGLGAALLLPQTMAIIIAIFPSDRRGKALGVWGAVAGLATIAGPTVGGMLVTWLGWRWIFFVNIPVGVVALLLAVVILPAVKGGERKRLDLGGVLISSVALVAITFGLVEGQAYRWGTVWEFVSIPLIIGFGLELLAVFVFVQGRRQDRQPLLPFSLFHDRNYALMSAASVIVSVALVGMALPLTIFLQSTMGFSAIKAGLAMAPAALVSGLTAPFAGRLADRGGKYLLMSGFLLYAAGLALIVTAAGSATHWYDLTPGYLVVGLGIGCTISPMQTIATRNVDPRFAGAASGVMNTFRQTGSALGSAVVLAVLQNRLAAHAGFVTSMRYAIAVPGCALVVAGLLCFGIERARIRSGSDKPLVEPVPPTKPRYLPLPSETPPPETRLPDPWVSRRRAAQPWPARRQAPGLWAARHPAAGAPASPAAAPVPVRAPVPARPQVPVRAPVPARPQVPVRSPASWTPASPARVPSPPGGPRPSVLPPSANAPRVTPTPPSGPRPVSAAPDPSVPVPAPPSSGPPFSGPPSSGPLLSGPPVPPSPVPDPPRESGPPVTAMPMLAAPVFPDDEALHVVEVPPRARPARAVPPRYVEEPRPGDPLPDGPLHAGDFPPD